MALCKNLADRLNDIRTSRHLSLTNFSEELGISRSSLQALLSGTGNPRADTIEQIAEKLGTDPVWLLSAQQNLSEIPIPTPAQQLTQMQDLLELLKELLGENYE